MMRSIRIRAFIAIKMNAETEGAIANFVEELRPLAPTLRWIPRANFHLTLRFLGNDVPISKIEELSDELARIAAATRRFKLIAQGVGAFPNLGRPRVVWIGLRGDGLLPLAGEIRAACTRVAFVTEDHPYSPHLTIARARDPKGLKGLRSAIEDAAARSFGESIIDSMALYRSVLGRSSPTYLELARWELGAD